MRRVLPAQVRRHSFHEIAKPNRIVLVDGMVSVYRLKQRQTRGSPGAPAGERRPSSAGHVGE
jgi:hypothetical protein